MAAGAPGSRTRGIIPCRTFRPGNDAVNAGLNLRVGGMQASGIDDLLEGGHEALSPDAWQDARVAFEQALKLEETPVHAVRTSDGGYRIESERRYVLAIA